MKWRAVLHQNLGKKSLFMIQSGFCFAECGHLWRDEMVGQIFYMTNFEKQHPKNTKKIRIFALEFETAKKYFFWQFCGNGKSQKFELFNSLTIMIKRERYVERLKNLLGIKVIKVITGLRRVGKSTLFKQFQYELSNSENKKFQLDLQMFNIAIKKYFSGYFMIFLDDCRQISIISPQDASR
jgi:hypothetical protein